MKFKTYSIFAGVAVLAAALFPGEGAEANGEIVWLDSYPKALEQAKISGKPILLTFRCVP